jgi:triosephosphate isomerase
LVGKKILLILEIQSFGIMRKKIVAGNWKMNNNREQAMALVTEIKGMLSDDKDLSTEVIVAPPFVHLASVCQLAKGSKIKVAAQNCSNQKEGAFTGEVSAGMIASVGASHVIVGHSERRSIFGESSDVIMEKVGQVHSYGLTAIICIGESLAERESGNHTKVVATQLEESVFNLASVDPDNTIIAYEPVWAIGTGITASAEQAQEMHLFIRTKLKEKYASKAESFSILYGGSCNEANAEELFNLDDVDGGLIGGASLKSRSFVNIVNAFS